MPCRIKFLKYMYDSGGDVCSFVDRDLHNIFDETKYRWFVEKHRHKDRERELEREREWEWE